MILCEYHTAQIPKKEYAILKRFAKHTDRFICDILVELISKGVQNPTLYSAYKEKMQLSETNRLLSYRGISKSANLFLLLLQEAYGIVIEREYYLDGRYFDGRYGNILIEVDGKYWHSSKRQKKIDREKTAIAKRNGFVLLRFEVNSTADAPRVLQESLESLNPLLLH